MQATQGGVYSVHTHCTASSISRQATGLDRCLLTVSAHLPPAVPLGAPPPPPADAAVSQAAVLAAASAAVSEAESHIEPEAGSAPQTESGAGAE